MRNMERKNNQMRLISVEKNYLPNALASCLIKIGKTHVICSATLEEYVPPFLKGKGAGWLTAEYCMLPSSSSSRIKREVNSGKLSGRTQEIQRLISRSLRSVLDLQLLGERQITVDCDVISADGGTRCAAITGGYVALEMAIERLLAQGVLRKNPILHKVAAISCGILNNQVIVDLDFPEDSNAQVDANFVINSNMDLVEVQATSEKSPFSQDQLFEMLQCAKEIMPTLFNLSN